MNPTISPYSIEVAPDCVFKKIFNFKMTFISIGNIALCEDRLACSQTICF